MEAQAHAQALARGAALDALLLVAAKAALGAWILHVGFKHVSDDDYARVVIAEGFTHAPKLDPSGTSWLPFPFWLNGAAMMAFGRSLRVANGLAFAVGTLSVVAPYAAMRAAGCGRVTAFLAVAVAMAVPWSAWLGVATVPEAMTACLIAAGAIAVTSPSARPWAAAGLLVAALSRYEAWPACAVLALACVLLPASGPGASRTRAVAIGLAVLGPLAWMAWNAHAHGSPVHFLARVAAYRQAIGAAPSSLLERLTAFPRAIFTAAPAVAACAALGAPALAKPRIRARWAWPLASALAILAFLVLGDVRDGAPTHHPERAVVPIVWILAGFAVDALGALLREHGPTRASHRSLVVGAVAAALICWAALLPARWADHPAASDAERRDAQIARGLALAAEAPGGFAVTPCAYEHFALIAAFGAPERVSIVTGTGAGTGTAPATHDAVTAACPEVMVPGREEHR